MENLLLITLIILLILALVGITALLWLGHRYLKLKEGESKPKTPKASSSAISGAMEAASVSSALGGADILRSLKGQGSGLYCIDHPDMIAVGQCAISGESFCEHCLTNQQDIKLAKKYIDLYLDGKWVEVLMLKNNEISQDAADRIVKVKKSLWKEQAKPLIVQGHYKINVQTDEIEAFTVVIALEDDTNFIKKELSFINF